MSKTNTLFSYFSKTPTRKQDDTKNEAKKDVLNPKRSPNQASNAPREKQTTVKEENPGEGDIIWAKLDGYPWWPAMVCSHPTKNTHIKPGKSKQYHVQFFDDPISRGWVKEKFIHPFKGSTCKEFQRGGKFYCIDQKCKDGAQEADKALKESKSERLKRIVELQPSSDEEDNDEDVAAETMMDIDADIFDTEISEGEEADNSKENIKSEDTSKKTPNTESKKTPTKSLRSSRRPKAKRRRIIESDNEFDESEDEFKPEPVSESDHESSGVEEDDISEIESGSEPETPVKDTNKRKRGSTSNKSKASAAEVSKTPARTATLTPARTPSLTPARTPSLTPARTTSFTPKVSNQALSKLSSFAASDNISGPAVEIEDGRTFKHLTYEFLKPANIRDAQKRKMDHPEYDPRTLHVPDSFMQQQTPGIRQWWELKAKYFDTVLFFKMGKFYEFFHMDAVTGVNELGIIYMKGEQAHSGFPENAYGRYADTLVQKGYKVARIEQTETPDMMNDRVKKLARPTKFDKVVNREVCKITSKGTKTSSFIDGEISEAQNNFLLAFCEQELGGEKSLYGVCFVDASIGKFQLGQFEDDRHCSRFRTLISHFPPAQVLFEKHKISERTQNVVKNNLTTALKDFLKSGSQFWDSSKTLKCLAESDYFLDEEKPENGSQIPDVLKTMIAEGDSLCQNAAEGYDLAISALGAMTWYLQQCFLDHELLSLKKFEEYCPIDQNLNQAEKKKVAAFAMGHQRMVLDGVTLANLDVLENSNTGTLEGTLLERLDQCYTPFGKRLFRQWLCAPLCNPTAIDDRLNAVEDIMENQEVISDITETLKKLPDLERLLSKIHTLGSATRLKNHPDGRAIMQEEVTYSKRKIEDFLSTLNGFKQAKKIVKKFSKVVKDFKSQLLKQTVQLETEEDGKFPDLDKALEFFDKAFDHDKARQQGTIHPRSGVDPDYDLAMEDTNTTKSELDEYLRTQKKLLGCQTIVYWGTGKNRYQMEIPESVTKKVPKKYEITSSKKGYKRYQTTEIKDLIVQLTEAEERRDVALKDTMRRIFFNFDKRYKKWDTTVQCLAVLDVLISLAQYSRCGDGDMCRPEVVVPEEGVQPFLELRDARHPCISRTFAGGDFIPNDTVIGIKDENDMEENEVNNADSKVVLVTGPNMGGKSTLMRQAGIVVVIAQLGCYVPAIKCRLTPVERIFTRLGATDRIMAGESTFFVELSETSAILQHATKHSLVLVDELGRGTATYDGTAIACAVVNELSQNIKCRTLFSTHYHSLVEEFVHDPNIRLGHMACMVENENEDDPSQETITFLYKFVKGACPKSYGFNVASLADVPDEIIQIAKKKAVLLEESIERLGHFKKLYNMDSTIDLSQLQNWTRAIKI